MSKPKEGYIYEQSLKLAKRYRWEHIKLEPGSSDGKPDNLFLRYPGEVLFVEFKRPGEVPERLQLWWHKKLRELGFRVRVVDSTESAVKAFSNVV